MYRLIESNLHADDVPNRGILPHKEAFRVAHAAPHVEDGVAGRRAQDGEIESPLFDHVGHGVVEEVLLRHQPSVPQLGAHGNAVFGYKCVAPFRQRRFCPVPRSLLY